MKTINDFLRLNLQYFNDPGAGDPPPNDPPPNDPPPNDSGAGDPPPNDPPPSDKTFTQAELDQIVKDRLARDRKKFADYEEIRTKLAEFEAAEKKRKESEMSELEKLQSQLQEKEANEAALQQQLAAVNEAIKNDKIRKEFDAVASSKSIAYLDDAFAFADLSAVEVGEDGKVSGIDNVVDELVKNKPYLVVKKQQKQIGDPTNNPGGQHADKTAEQLLKEAAEKARRTGKAEDRAAYAKLKAELGK